MAVHAILEDSALDAAMKKWDAPPSLAPPSRNEISALDEMPSVPLPTINVTVVDEVKEYLWSVYQRSGTKRDSHGDFTWKDASAAARLGLSVKDFVIDGMDADFREQLFAVGHSMDAAGIEWTILSAFRDDYRQSLATGFRAQVGTSFHGGSIATGGYGRGCAVDVASADGVSNDTAWTWIDLHGRRFGLERPMARIDPAHVQPRARWHELAATLRNRGSRFLPFVERIQPAMWARSLLHQLETLQAQVSLKSSSHVWDPDSLASSIKVRDWFTD